MFRSLNLKDYKGTVQLQCHVLQILRRNVSRHLFLFSSTGSIRLFTTSTHVSSGEDSPSLHTRPTHPRTTTAASTRIPTTTKSSIKSTVHVRVPSNQVKIETMSLKPNDDEKLSLIQIVSAKFPTTQTKVHSNRLRFDDSPDEIGRAHV